MVIVMLRVVAMITRNRPNLVMILKLHDGLDVCKEGLWLYIYIYNIYNMSGRTRMLYIAYDTPTSKYSCLSAILKIKAILAK